MTSIFLKTLYDKRWFTFGWSLGFIALAALMVTFYPAMHKDGSLDQLLQNMPAAFQGFVGDLSNLREFSTYLASQMFDVRMQIIGGVMVIILSLGLSVGEEDRGTTRTLLSLPISRSKLLIQKWCAMSAIIACTVIASGLGIIVFQNTIGESIDLNILARLLVMTWLLLTALASITYAAAMATGSRSFAMTVGILLVAGSFILTTFSVGVDWLRDYEMWSVFYYYPTIEITKEGINSFDVVMLAGLTIVPLIIAWLAFRYRDVR